MGIETALAIGALTAAAVGTGVSVYGAVEQADAAKKTSEYNSQLAEDQAAALDAENVEAMRRQRVENRRIMADQRSRFAASGVSLETGSPLVAQAETARILEVGLLDQQRVSQAQQRSLRSQASMSRWQGGRQSTAAYISGGASLLSGIGQMAGSSYQFNRDGIF